MAKEERAWQLCLAPQDTHTCEMSPQASRQSQPQASGCQLTALCSGAARWGGTGVSPGSGTQSCFSHSSVKNVTLVGVGGFFFLFSFSPPLSTQLLMRQFAGARQTQPGTARLLPGGQRWEWANRAMWHFWCKHVACWRAKSLVGGLYLFFKELVRFIYTHHCLHVA